MLTERGHQYKGKEIKHDLCGLFHCSCGMMITAENKIKVQKNGNRHSYTYYRCSRKSKTIKCKERTVREELLDERLSDFLSDFAPSQAMSDFLLNRLEQDAKIERANYNATRAETEQKFQSIATKQKILFDSYLEQDIDRETFLNKKAELLGEKKSLAEFLNNFEASQKSWVEPLPNKPNPQLASYHNDKRAGENLEKIPELVRVERRSSLGPTPKNKKIRASSNFFILWCG